MGYVALYREWRPQLFSDIVGQEHISRTLQNAIKADRTAHAYLFCGPRGTGKTTTAKVMAKALNCLNGPGAEPCNECENCKRVTAGNSMDVMEIDAASNRGIDEIRDLREKVKFAPTEGKYRIYIIDEVHMLTTEAFNALLKTLEEPPAHVIFILATTEPHKLPLTILSRCQRFDFRRIGIMDIVARLQTVVSELDVIADEEALGLIARMAEGGMRDALSVLDQCISFGGQKISVADVNDVLGTVNIDILIKMTEFFCEKETTGALKLVDDLVRLGKDVQQFAKDLTEHFRNLLLTDVCDDVDELVPVSDEILVRMKALSSRLGRKKIMSLIEIFTSSEREMKWTSQPRLVLELAVIKAGESPGELAGDKAGNPVVQDSGYEELIGRITRLEELIARGLRVQGPETAALAATSTATKARPGKSQKHAAQSSLQPERETDEKMTKDKMGDKTGDQTRDNVAGNIDTETIKKCWQEILERIKKVRMSARAFMIEGEPVEVTEGTLVLSFPPEYGFHKEKVEQPENRKAIAQVVEEVTGARLKIKCTFTGESPKKVPARSNQGDDEDRLIKKAITLFGGDVVEIKD